VSVKKLLPVSILIAVVLCLSQWIRVPSGRTAAANQALANNQFVLKESYPLNNDTHRLLATIYATGKGAKEQEILSIWSAETDGYQLRYIRTAEAGHTFIKPPIFNNQDLSFIKIATQDRKTGAVSTHALLSLKSDDTVREVIPVKLTR
jgi:hypothetical protein